MPAAGTEQGQSMAQLWAVFLWAGVGVGGLVWVLATWSLLRYRRRGDALPTQTRGNLAIEAAWTIVPLIVVVILFGLTLGTLGTVLGADPGPSDVRLQATAYRWGWAFVYPDAGVTVASEPGAVPQIELPVGTTVHVELTSLDVIHAFYVPDFLFKRDAIPGRTSTFDLRIVAPGTYGGACAEYCGVYHDDMPFQIVGVTTAQYQAWLAGHQGGSP